jgi:hypothetical protein
VGQNWGDITTVTAVPDAGKHDQHYRIIFSANSCISAQPNKCTDACAAAVASKCANTPDNQLRDVLPITEQESVPATAPMPVFTMLTLTSVPVRILSRHLRNHLKIRWAFP